MGNGPTSTGQYPAGVGEQQALRERGSAAERLTHLGDRRVQEEAKAEPQELNDGDSVMAYGRVGVLTRQGDEWWIWYHGSGTMGPFLADDLRLATDAEILAAHKGTKG